MDALRRRPLGTFAAFFYVFSCILFSCEKDVRTYVLIIASVSAVAVTALSLGVRVDRAVTAAVAALLAAALFAGYTVDVAIARKASLVGGDGEIEGTVTERGYSSAFGGSYILETRDMRLSLESENGELRVGDTVSCRVHFHSPDSASAEYLASKGIFVSAETEGEVGLLGRGDVSFFAGLRQKLSSRLLAEMSADGGGFAAALILGDRLHLPDSIDRDFRALGITHMLALSGTHLTSMFSLIERFLPRGKGLLRLLVLCPAVIFYMALTGFSSSVVRAGIMYIAAKTAAVIKRDADSFTSLSVSVLLIAVADPYSVFDCGLQLSFLSMLGLIASEALRRDIETKRRTRLPAPVGDAVSALVVPSLILPVARLRFGGTSLASPVANLLLAPAFALFIPLLGAMLAVSWIPPLFVPLAGLADYAITRFLGFVSSFAEAWDAVLPLRGGVTGVLVGAFAVLAVAAALAGARIRRILLWLCSVTLSAALFSAQVHEACLRDGVGVYYAANGKNEAVCIVSDGCTVLVDIGAYPAAARTAAETALGGTSGRIDSLVFTHLHQSHGMTLAALSGDFHIESIWLPVPYNESSAAISEMLGSEAERLGIAVRTYASGERLSVGRGLLRAPTVGWSDTSEHPTVSFAVEYGGHSVEYSTAGADGATGADAVHLIGVHGPKRKGTASPSDCSVISSECAASLDAVGDGALVSDNTFIDLALGETPRVTAVRAP